MEKLKSPQSPIIIDPCGVDEQGNLRIIIGVDKTTDPHIFIGGTIVRQVGPMPPPTPNSKRRSL